MDRLEELLRDVMFVSMVLMKGRFVRADRVESLENLNKILSSYASKGLYFVSCRGELEGKEINAKILVRDGKIVAVIVEYGGNVIRGIEAFDEYVKKSGGFEVRIFEVPAQLTDLFPILREALESIEKAGSPPMPAPTPAPRPPTPPSPKTETVAKAPETTVRPAPAPRIEAEAVRKPVTEEPSKAIERALRDTYIESSVALNVNPATVTITVKVRNIPPPGITDEMISWIALSRAMEVLTDEIRTKPVTIIVETPTSGSMRFDYPTAIQRNLAFFHGVVVRKLYPSGLLITDIKPRLSPDGTRAEIQYGVKPRSKDIEVSSEMLRRLARECVQEIKAYTPLRVRIVFRGGLFLKGEAEA